MTTTHPIATTGKQPSAEQTTDDQASGERHYWRSYDQLQNTPEFQELLHREFPEGASEAPDDLSLIHI